MSLSERRAEGWRCGRRAAARSGAVSGSGGPGAAHQVPLDRTEAAAGAAFKSAPASPLFAMARTLHESVAVHVARQFVACLLTIASKCSNVCGKTGGDKDNEFYCMT